MRADADYQALPDAYDEYRAGNSRRPYWDAFAGSVDRIGPEEWARRWQTGRRILREHGVTHNVYGDPNGLDRLWELDSIPLLIAPEDWRVIEAGVAQRAWLMNAMLVDLYGPKRLLREGLIPPELVFANPNFWRALHDVRVPSGIYLHLFGADVGRCPSGEWRLMADRTQTASGTGYALENRTVLARCLPDVIRECRAQRVVGFFDATRRLLAGLSPRATDNPRIVLLTPGPRSPTYFEHAYLSRQLGFELVEATDLTVRDDRVLLKVLEGLLPVDVILRRMDDAWCDPLELDRRRSGGVSGLVQAARAGNVAIANALGAGLVEAPAFTPFLPNICRVLLGEDLRLPSVATWWCGQPEALRYVLEHLQSLVIKPAFNPRSSDPIFVYKLDAAGVAALAERLRARPAEFVAEEYLHLSGAPVGINGRWEARPVLLRAFAAAHPGRGYTLMPGGLTRVIGGSTEGGGGYLNRADGSKDTWILGGADTAEQTLGPGREAAPGIVRGSNDLPSRVADDLFWLGRYAERAEVTARIVRTVLQRFETESPVWGTVGLASLTQILDSLGLLTMHFGGRQPDDMAPAIEHELVKLLYQAQRPRSLRDELGRLHHLAAGLRDRLSSDTWRILNELYRVVAEPDRLALRGGEVLAVLNQVIGSLAAFSGMEMENMTRGHGWRFLEMGRRLERAVQLCGLLRVALPELDGVVDQPIFEALLEIADSTMTYRSRYFATFWLAPVYDLLLADESNPRSIAFQLVALRQHVVRLPRDPAAPVPTPEETLAEKLVQSVRSVAFTAEALEPALAGLAQQLRLLSEAVTLYYFSHGDRRRPRHA